MAETRKSTLKSGHVGSKGTPACWIAAAASVLVWVPTGFPGWDKAFYFMAAFWVWTISLLICARSAKGFKGYLILFAAVWISGTMSSYGLYGEGFVNFIPCLISGMIIFPAFLADGLLNRKYNRFVLTFVFPLLYTLLLIAISAINLGTSLKPDMYLSVLLVPYQIVSVVGAYGMCFLTLWICTCVLYIYQNRRNFKKLKPAVACPIVVIAVLGFGLVRLYSAPEADFHFKAAYAVGPYRGDFMDYDFTVPYEENAEYFISTCREAAEQGAAFIAYTEEAFCLEDGDAEAFVSLAQNEAAKNRIAVLIGLEVEFPNTGAKSLNKTVWIDPCGEIKTEYMKNCLIPIMESLYYEPGDKVIPYIDMSVDGHEVRISTCICYDGDNPFYTYRTDPKTEVFVLPSWEWSYISEKHNMSTAYIPLQNHVTFLKAAYDGYALVADPYGRRTYLEQTDRRGSMQVQIVDIPVFER